MVFFNLNICCPNLIFCPNFIISKLCIRCILHDGRTSKERLKKLPLVPLNTQLSWVSKRFKIRVTSSDFKHVFHLENDSLACVVLKNNSSLCSEISKTLRVFEIPSIFEGVMLILV